MIQAKHLTKDYDDLRAVDDISFSVASGQTLVLIGTSGCGKTTILRMLNRLIEPTHGEVIINGTSIGDTNPVELRRSIGYVIQDIGLFPHYTIQENISVVPRLLKMNTSLILRRVSEYMERLKIPYAQYANKYPHELSGGQQQRVGLARALAADPPIILMDEPFGALDPITRREIRDDFKELDELSNKTTILVTHDILEAVELGDQICILDKGRLQQMGTPKEIIFHPANRFVESFMSGRLLELEFHAVTLRDIFERLPHSFHTEANNIIAFHPDDNIMKVLSKIISKSQNIIAGSVQIEGVTKYFDSGNIVENFHKVPYK